MNWKMRKIVKMMMRKSRTAQINDLIDLYIHPLMRKNPNYKLIDFILHAMNEGDLEKSVKKFMRYNKIASRKRNR
ncbi:MAG: hypothetical protein QW087_07720 [Methanomassiliicoccales archaeon]